LDPGYLAHQRVDRQPKGADEGEELLLRVKCSPLADTRSIAEDRERPPRRDAGVELAQRTGGCVARVGKGGLAVFLFFPVDVLKRLQGQVDLTPHLQQLWDYLAGKPQGERADRPDIRGHVFTGQAVAAGGGD